MAARSVDRERLRRSSALASSSGAGEALNRLGTAADAQGVAVYDKVMLAGVLLAVSPVLLRGNTAVMLLELTTEVVQTVAAWLFRVGVTLAFLGAAAHVVVRVT